VDLREGVCVTPWRRAKKRPRDSGPVSGFQFQGRPGKWVVLRAVQVRACQNGVKRSHVIDAAVPGALLVELYSRDGLGVMVSGDFFEVREIS